MIPKLSLPIQLLIVLCLVFFSGQLLPLSTFQFFYTISLTFKEGLSFLLPFLVFSFVCTGILSFKKNAPLVIGIILVAVLLSNSMTSFFSYFICTTVLKHITNNVVIDQIATHATLTPLWTIQLPKFISSEHALLYAIIVGFFLSFIPMPQAEATITRFKQSIEWIMNKIFIPILPIYVLGFLLEIKYQGVFLQLFSSFSKTYMLMALMHAIVIFIIYFIASNFHLKQAIIYIKNAIPSYMTAFSSMSSTATIPVTINCTNKNIDNPALSNVATPILANIHLIGDSVSTPVLALSTLFLFTGTIPTISTFALFIGYFCLTMLAVSGVPGGGIIVMIPILKNILGFSDAMASIITTLYLLQDSFGTAANVMGDGALTIIINKILKKLRIS